MFLEMAEVCEAGSILRYLVEKHPGNLDKYFANYSNDQILNDLENRKSQEEPQHTETMAAYVGDHLEGPPHTTLTSSMYLYDISKAFGMGSTSIMVLMFLIVSTDGWYKQTQVSFTYCTSCDHRLNDNTVIIKSMVVICKARALQRRLTSPNGTRGE